MLTALLLLLGLSGAGAGLYSVLKDPKDNSPTGTPAGETVFSGGSRPPGQSSRSSESRPGQGSSTREGLGKNTEQDSRSSRDFKQDLKPESLPLGDYGSDENIRSSDNRIEDFRGMGNPSVTFTADDIISKNSKYSHHRRPLLNAEALVDKQKVNEAIEIYERTEARIPDEEIKEKLKQNINDLKSFKSMKEKLDDLFDEEEFNEEEGFSDQIRPPRTSSPIPIRDLAEAIREIAEAMSEALSRGLYPATPQNQQPIPPPYSQPPGSTESNPWSPPPLPNQSDDSYKRQLPPNYFPAPIVYQIITNPSGDFQAKYDPKLSPPATDPTGHPELFTPTPPPTPPPTPQTAPPPIPHEPTGYMDLPEDTFFTREWDRYKDLPLTDRRSGKERRQNKDRRTNLSRRDRRSGEDRRKIDLFKEREEYLKKKAEEKKEIQGTDPPPGRLSDKLEPYYPPVLPPAELVEIGLPSPEAFQLEGGKSEEFSLPVPIEYRKESDKREELELPEPEDISPPKEEPISKDFPPIEIPPIEIPPIELPRIEIPPIEIPPLEQVDSNKSKFDDLPVIDLPDPEEMRREMGPDGPVLRPPVSGDLDDQLEELEDRDSPEIEVVDGDLDDQLGEIETPEEPVEEEKEPEKILHGVLELKPPEVDDAPFLTLTYDFSKIPHGFRLSKNYSIMEYSYYKYKPMLMKAQEFARRKMLKNALNYYRVIKSQNIPPEMRKMINRNIQDITEFMEKFLMAKGG